MSIRLLLAAALGVFLPQVGVADPPRLIFETRWYLRDVGGQLDEIAVAHVGKGQLEFHVYEDSEYYRGVPWHVLIDRRGDSKLQIRKWTGSEVYRVGDPIPGEATSEEYDFSGLQPIQLAAVESPDGSRVFANIVPKLRAPELEPAEFDAQTLALDYLCFQNSPVIVDENFVVGQLSGVKQYAVIDIPELAIVSFSLTPIEGWTRVGTLEAGVIEIDLPEGHVLTIPGVRLGPFGNVAPGPFHIHGLVESSGSSRAEVLQRVETRLPDHYSGQRLDVMRTALLANPFAQAGSITVGSKRDSSPHYERLVGETGRGTIGCLSPG